MKLVVAPSAAVAQAFASHRPSHVLGLLSPGQEAIMLPCEPQHRLELRFNDIDAARDGLVAPNVEALRAIFDFAASWDGVSPLLVYCFAGISRSTAAAFAIACHRDPTAQEAALARILRTSSASATPNPLMIALADSLLGRQGRMIEAALAIGRGEGAFSQAFEWPLPAFSG